MAEYRVQSGKHGDFHKEAKPVSKWLGKLALALYALFIWALIRWF